MLEQLAQAVGVQRAQLQGRLSALTRHINAFYGEIGWPLTWVQDSNGDYQYWMDDEIAAKWRMARG